MKMAPGTPGAGKEDAVMKAVGIALMMLGLLAFACSAYAQADYYFEYQGTPVRGFDPSWPPDGAPWHELVPNYCVMHTQSCHGDANGNGQMDVCELIALDCQPYHIDWIGPTYVLRFVGSRPMADKYLEDAPGRQTGTYHEVYPIFCNIVETDPPITEVCQEVWITYPPEDVGWWHVEEINTDIRTSPCSPVENTTWAKVKNIFKNLRSLF
jgi:hypothetical protein